MRVLVACEYSGIVRDAFLKRGQEAWSCDILPSESRLGPHYQGDVRNALKLDWDLIVAHPPCTRLCNSGARWLHERNLWADLDDAAGFFRLFLEHPCPRIAIENPIPHRHAVSRIGRRYDQKVQPWQFGHLESKAVCLWLKGLPRLVPTDNVYDRMMKLPAKERNKVHWMGSGKGKERSRFFEGIADAMADQWGRLP